MGSKRGRDSVDCRVEMYIWLWEGSGLLCGQVEISNTSFDNLRASSIESAVTGIDSIPMWCGL